MAVRYTPYEFKRSDAYDFASFIGAQTREGNGQLHFTKCPYCGQNTNDKRTFAIDLSTGQFKCLRASCSVSGNMIKLSQDFGFSLGNEVDEYIAPKKKYKTYKAPPKPIEPKPPAIEYLKSRGISEEVAKRYEITVQTEHENVLVFPFYDEKGEMCFIKYRKTDFQKGKDQNKEWCEAGMKPILFGMKQCNTENKTIIFCEGQIDSLTVAECGFENAVSVPTGKNGFTWVPYCWDFINRFETIIVFGDLENGGMTLLDDIAKRFKKRIKRVRDEDYKDCKDANDILRKYGKEQIKACIENSEVLPVNGLIEANKIRKINSYDYTKLKTGISELDSLLYGGLPFGGITLVTGKRGEGKSTLASQIILQGISEGHKCMAYSGELANHLFMNWFYFQAAGQRHVIAYRNKWGDEGFSVSDTNIALIDAWIDKQLYLYDSSNIEKDERTDLIKMIEIAITRYCVDVILIDNLMTALDLVVVRNIDKYEKQSLFVKELTRIALRYNVLIVLVAHMRKNGFSTDGNDEVSGSSDITNLASVTLTYERSKDVQENQRILRCVKNRLFGKTEFNGFTMSYDEKSKRVYGVHDDVNREYGWNTGKGESILDYVEVDDSETPFD